MTLDELRSYVNSWTTLGIERMGVIPVPYKGGIIVAQENGPCFFVSVVQVRFEVEEGAQR